MSDPTTVQAAPGVFASAPAGFGVGDAPQQGSAFGGPGGGSAPAGPPGGGPHEALRKEATTWLVIAAVSIFVCSSCCVGMIGAVMCFLALQAADQGNVADAEAKLRWGKIITIAGIVLGVLTIVGYTLYHLLWAAAAIAS